MAMFVRWQVLLVFLYLVVWLPTDFFSALLKLNLFGWVVVDDWRMLTNAWSLRPFLILSSVILSVTLGSSLTKNLTFQYTLINLPVVATINFSSCVLFPVPYLMMHAFVTRRLDQCCSVLVGLPLTLTARLDTVLRSAARLIGGVPKYASISGYMRDTLHWLPIQQRIFYRVAVLVWHCFIGIAPIYLLELCSPVSTLVGRQALRSSSGAKLLVPRVNTSTMQRRAFSVVTPAIWNSLPSQIRLLPKSYTPLLYKLLKTDLFHRGWTGSAS